MIHSHLYTNKAKTDLYTAAAENAKVLASLTRNTWLGVFEIIDGWCRVLTVLGEGWVQLSDTEQRSPFNLHVQWTPDKTLEYISAA